MSVDMSSSGSTSPTSKSGQALQKLKEFGYAFNSGKVAKNAEGRPSIKDNYYNLILPPTFSWTIT